MTISTRASIATVVAVTPDARYDETLATIRDLRGCPAIRAIVITPGQDPQPEIQTADDDTTIVRGLVPRYLNNAVAALRLSSLPTIAWWRGGDVSVLDGLATLVDRLVLDAEEPQDAWRAAIRLFERTAVSDFRWTRLTPVRKAAAQAFTPDRRSPGLAFDDVHERRLFDAWLAARGITIEGTHRRPAPARSLTELLIEELGVRARDLSFEQAVQRAVEAS